jgi:flagellum-specific peptidoglycan hydrolase FlgJ
VAGLVGGARPARPMAVPMRQPLVPMAVPMEQPGPSKAAQLVALGALALALAGLWGQESVVAITRVALDGLRSSPAYVAEIDAADLPAMDPGLARIVDPRARPVSQVSMRTRQVAVQPFEYDVRAGETLQEIATRFGTDVGALLWNNGLDSADQVVAGARLTVLPVRGVLHLVRPEDTLAAIAERYGSRLEDLILANALERADAIAPGQVIVVAGGTVPAAIAQAQVTSESAHLQSTEIVGEPGLTAIGAAVERPAEASVAEVLPEPPDAADWQRDFIMSIAPGARASQRSSGVPASVTLAQAILESDWGRSKLTREANNLFGIKAFNRPVSSGVYEINTWEVYGGQSVTVFAAFRAYASLADSIADHGTWFHDNDRYHRALDVKDDPRAFARAINAAGYATDPSYAPKLIGLMDRFNLYAYDVEPPPQN